MVIFTIYKQTVIDIIKVGNVKSKNPGRMLNAKSLLLVKMTVMSFLHVILIVLKRYRHRLPQM